jgi:choline dehydrogenase-like flavoprotein
MVQFAGGASAIAIVGIKYLSGGSRYVVAPRGQVVNYGLMQQDDPLVQSEAERDFADQVTQNQGRLSVDLQQHYDFIVCGAGTAGSVIARRLAENPDVTVLLLEAGGSDNAHSVADPNLWSTNLGGHRDWAFRSEPNRYLNQRSLMLPMGKVLGGGSSINVMIWARGHTADWDFFASEAGSTAWSYSSVVDIYRRAEDWKGPADPEHRGTGGPVHVQPSQTPNPTGAALIEAAAVANIKSFDSPNGVMMEGPGGAATADVIVRDGLRQSIFRSYTYPHMDRPNLTVLTCAHVRRVLIERNQATGVEVVHRGQRRQFRARGEIVLALGAIQTPKVLMLSGVGDREQLDRHAIPVVQHLPGVGRNFQDHLAFTCMWESPGLYPTQMTSDAVLFWSSTGSSAKPDLFACYGPIPFASQENIIRYGLPEAAWILHGALTQPESRGSVELTGPDPEDPVRVVNNALSHHGDLTKAIACIQMMREVGNAAPLAPYVKREVMPGNLKGAELIRYIRDAGVSYWHVAGTARMGRDPMAVVGADLRVYGVENLRVADASIMPRITTGNTMAPCVVIGERGAAELKSAHGL